MSQGGHAVLADADAHGGSSDEFRQGHRVVQARHDDRACLVSDEEALPDGYVYHVALCEDPPALVLANGIWAETLWKSQIASS